MAAKDCLDVQIQAAREYPDVYAYGEIKYPATVVSLEAARAGAGGGPGSRE